MVRGGWFVVGVALAVGAMPAQAQSSNVDPEAPPAEAPPADAPPADAPPVEAPVAQPIPAPAPVAAPPTPARASTEVSTVPSTPLSERLWWIVGGEPKGTALMIKRHAVMAFSFGMNPATISVGDGNPPAAPVAMSGFYYEERGGMVTQLVSLLLAGAGAQEHANRTGDDTRIRSEGFDSDALGMAIHFRSASGIGFHFRADLFIGGPVLKVGELPLVLDFGLTAGIMGPFAAGIVVRAAFPVTRFAALEATTHLGWGNVNELTAGAVLNGGNRFFVRGRAVLGASGIGYNGMVGVRL